MTYRETRRLDLDNVAIVDDSPKVCPACDKPSDNIRYNDYNDQGNKICKNCYQKRRYARIKEIDVSGLQVNKRQKQELTFVKVAKKPSKKFVKVKNWDSLDSEKKQEIRKHARTILDKRFAKKFNTSPLEDYFPFITDLVAHDGTNSKSCNLCGNSTIWDPGLGYVIPNGGHEIVLCLECLRRSYKLCMALKINGQENGKLKNLISTRQQRNQNMRHRIKKDKNDPRSTYEIVDDIGLEVKNELGIPGAEPI